MKKIDQLIQDKALFFINHSGGKDSQAMYLYLTRTLRIPDEQIMVIHAELPGADWDGIEDHIRMTIESNHPYTMVRANKTFREMVLNRGMFPSPKYRQCTSDLKRDPIAKFIRNYAKETGNYLIVNCTGIRAEESSARSKQNPFKLNARMSKAGRTVYDWMPIFTWKENEVYQFIADQDQKPFWTYAEGMTRCSCKICIMSSYQDANTASKIDPGYVNEIEEMEEITGQSMFYQKGGKVAIRDYVNKSISTKQKKDCHYSL